MQYGETGIINLDLTKSTAVRNEQGAKVGQITPGENEHGNALFYATSTHTEDELVTRTKGAAEYWVKLRDDIVRAQVNR